MSKKVALVLSSGGARGLAHIGVIEALESNGYEITSIAGSSIGAVVAAFHACGELEKYKEWAINLDRYDVFKLIDFTFSVQGFVKGEKVFKTLEKLIPDRKIEDLKIPFAALVTDIGAKKEVVFDKGSMYQAVKASVAIPTVIRPVTINKVQYIDGGVTNPIPIEHVKRHEGDLLVVSNVNAIKPFESIENKPTAKEVASYNEKIQSFISNWGKLLPGSTEVAKKLGFFDILSDSIDLMQDRLTSLLLEKHHPDMLISISRDAASTFEFFRAKELIEVGRVQFEKALKESQRISE